MEYTGKFKDMDSVKYGRVSVLEYRSKHSIPYCECTRCGKPIKRVMYVVQDSNDTEVEYHGSECIKRFA